MALPPAAAPPLKPEQTAATQSPPPAAGSQPAQQPNKPAAAPPAGTPPAGTPPAAKPAAKGGSIYEAIGEPPPGEEGSAAWPSDWREQVSEGIDPKQAKMLERFPSVKELAKSWIAQRQLISSGEYKRAAPKGDSPEELKAWREEQGIPDSPDGYEVPVAPGVDMNALDETSKAGIGVFKESFLAAGLNKEQGTVVAQGLLKMAALQTEATAQADASARDSVEDALRAEWGADYRRNLNMNGAFLKQHFGDGMESLLSARTPEGTRLADMPEFNKFLNAMARNTGGDVMFDGDVKGGASIESQLEEIRKVMRTDINKYNAEGLDVKYRELLEKQQARKGA